MNLRLILLLSLAGVVVGVLSVAGVLPSGAEFVTWIVLAFAFAVVLGQGARQRPFSNGFVAGFLASLFAALIQVALFERYLSTHPAAVMTLDQLPDGWYPQIGLLMLAPLAAGLNGLLVGALSWAAARVMPGARAGGTGARQP